LAYNVQSIINSVSQDCRNQLAATLTGPAQTALMDYLDRVHKEVIMWSNWDFMLTQPLFFITYQGQSDYWIGPTGDRPTGTVQTTCNISLMDRIRKDSVRDYSNYRQLKWLHDAPLGPVLTQSSGMPRPGQPAAWIQDYVNTPNILSIYPSPMNNNTYQPIPSTPVVDTVSGGALSSRVYYVLVTLVDSNGFESAPCMQSQEAYVAGNSLAVVRSPKLYFNQASSGVKYASYNVYAVQAIDYTAQSTDPDSETLQNVSPIPIGTDWYEPTSGLTTTGVMTPSNNLIEPLGGFIIGFRYYQQIKDLVTLDDVPQVPERYRDILISGVSAYAWELIGDDAKAMALYQKYSDGYRRMVVDKNKFPDGIEFVRPDNGSYVNQQILGYLPPFF
jgi:hypothetical protein